MVRDAEAGRLIARATAALRHDDLHAAGPLVEHLAERLPGEPEVLQLRGILAIKRQQPEEAVALLRRAVALAPQHPGPYANLATALRAMGDRPAAADSIRRALRLQPGRAELHCNLGNLLKDADQCRLAIQAFHRALVIDPGNDRALFNLGNLHHDALDIDAAASLLQWAAAAAGSVAIEASVNLGRVRERQGRLEAAADCYDRVIAAEPEHVYANFNRALLQLRHGDLAAGFRRYEWRWRLKDHPPRQFAQPPWRGEPLAGRTVLIHAEQGLGDSIHFCRYLPQVAARCGRVVFECQPPLLRLMRQSFPNVEVVAAGETLPAFDAHAPLMSLPLLLETRQLSDIPADCPYLSPPPPPTLPGSGVKVGLTWAGSPGHHLQPILRTIPFDDLAPLLDLPGLSLFSLQKGPAEADLAARPGLPVTDLAPRLQDFADTAAHVAALDIVVTIDTAVAHLAGALGKPVCILLRKAPDWRWLLDRDDSPWYPTATLFRQQHLGHWRPVVDAVAAHLRRFRPMGT